MTSKRRRKFLNLSDWQSYSRGQKLGFLGGYVQLAAVTREMPPRRYTLIRWRCPPHGSRAPKAGPIGRPKRNPSASSNAVALGANGFASHQLPGGRPMLLEQHPHGLPHTAMSEDHGRPVGPGNYRIEQRNQPFSPVEEGQFQGQCRSLPNLDTGRLVSRQRLPLIVEQRSELPTRNRQRNPRLAASTMRLS